MKYEALKWEVHDNPSRPGEKCIGVITLNRPEALNAVDVRMRVELDILCDEIIIIISQLVFGVKKLSLGNIHATRDFIYVLDTIKAITELSVNKKAVGKTIKKAKIGIVWHTTYKGDALQDMKASFGVNISSLSKPSSCNDFSFRSSSIQLIYSNPHKKRITINKYK